MAKILLIAPTCDGADVGEAWVAFQWARGLPGRHEVTLLTYHKRDRTPVAKQLTGLSIVEWTEPPLLGRNERLNSMLKPAYPWFYHKSRRWIKSALARGERFDLAFQPTPVAMRYPSPGAGLGIPLVIGPVGGGLDVPNGFPTGSETSPWYVQLRRLDQWRLARDPLLRRTYSTASCVIGIAPYVSDLLKNVPIRRFEALSETALRELPVQIDRSRRTGTVKLLYVGRLIRTKGAQDIIRAVGLLRDLNITLDVIGGGPEHSECRRLIQDLGLENVHLHGQLPTSRVEEFYRNADIFVFPSFREPGGNVVPEAMGFGLPVITYDRGGPGSATTDESAVRLTSTSIGALTSDIAEAIRNLVDDPHARLEMGRKAYEQVANNGLWDNKFDRADEIFESVVQCH